MCQCQLFIELNMQIVDLFDRFSLRFLSHTSDTIKLTLFAARQKVNAKGTELHTYIGTYKYICLRACLFVHMYVGTFAFMLTLT